MYSVSHANVFLESDARHKSSDADDYNSNANVMLMFNFEHFKELGMLKLVQEELGSNNYFKIDKVTNTLKHVPVQSGEENELVKNG